MIGSQAESGYDTCDYCGDCVRQADMVLVNQEKQETLYPGYGGDQVCKSCAAGQPEWYTGRHETRGPR